MSAISESNEKMKERIIHQHQNEVITHTDYRYNDGSEKVTTVQIKSCKKLIGTVNEIEEFEDYIIDNKYITTGYRINHRECATTVAKSLFKVHNESVNIWSHLLGTICVIVLVFYTFLYIQAHRSDILISFTDKLKELNEDIKRVTTPAIDLMPNFQNITSKIEEKYEISKNTIVNLTELILNKTSEYYKTIDTQIGISSGYAICYNCYDDVVQTLKTIKIYLFDHISIYTGKILNESMSVLEGIEDSRIVHYFEDIHSKLINFKNKLSDILDSHEGDLVNNILNHPRGTLERWPIFIMLTSAIICLGCSATFHWFMVHSRKLNDLLSRLDYAGISILIAGSCYPPYYYYYYCEAFWRTAYLMWISTFAMIVFIYSLKPDFNTPQKQVLRGSLFLTLGLSTAIPLLHLVFFPTYIKGFEFHPHFMYWYLGGASYVIGALIYINRIPEKFRPGTFDIIGNSHQIFHFCVLMGVAFHYKGSLESYYYRVRSPCTI